MVLGLLLKHSRDPVMISSLIMCIYMDDKTSYKPYTEIPPPPTHTHRVLNAFSHYRHHLNVSHEE